jgi:hypothetical protein
MLKTLLEGLDTAKSMTADLDKVSPGLFAKVDDNQALAIHKAVEKLWSVKEQPKKLVKFLKRKQGQLLVAHKILPEGIPALFEKAETSSEKKNWNQEFNQLMQQVVQDLKEPMVKALLEGLDAAKST